jgi:two-component system, NarL family, sensor histidine kinase DesK
MSTTSARPDHLDASVKESDWPVMPGQPGKNKWVFAAIWLIYLVGPAIAAVQADRSVAWKALNFALLGAFVLGYVVLTIASYPRSGPIGASMSGRHRFQIPLLAALAVIAAVTGTWVNHDFIGMWVYVGAGAGFSLPLGGEIALRCVLATVVGASLNSWVVGLDAVNWLALVFPTCFAGLGTIGIRRMAMLIGELREAREQVARLAANEERLRMARDLHDLTGHSLSLITLKAELAQRLLERSIAAAAEGGVETPRMSRALLELTDIENVSRQTLVDIREAVGNYRRPTLAVELSSACAALDAAGIKLDAEPSITVRSGTWESEAEAVLAWCLREAVTNVIRHADATKVSVRLAESDGELVLSVKNNGRGFRSATERERGDVEERLDADCDGAEYGNGLRGLRERLDADCDGAEYGNGLRGLRERLDALNGRLVVGGTDGDFTLVAAVPVSERVDA